MKAKQLERIINDSMKYEDPSTPILIYIPSKDEYFDISLVAHNDHQLININGVEIKDAIIITIDE